MDEASSKYVDQIATEKLINDKLKYTHHDPDADLSLPDAGFSDFYSLAKIPFDIIIKPDKSITFSSAIVSTYEENNQTLCLIYPAENPEGHIIFIHGLYEDNLNIYKYFISLLNKKGLNVYLLILPYHYKRKPSVSHFSGEFFFSANLNRSALAFKQAIYDLFQLYHFLRKDTKKEILIAGFSMGGGIALSLATLAKIDAVFSINPVCQIAELVWDSVLFSTIKKDLERKERTIADVQKKFAHFEPMNVNKIQTRHEKIRIGWGLYDQINNPDNYRLLIQKWHMKQAMEYKAGHLNILRVPKLATDLADFYLNGRSNELL